MGPVLLRRASRAQSVGRRVVQEPRIAGVGPVRAEGGVDPLDVGEQLLRDGHHLVPRGGGLH